jgi:peptide/nickel transport system ATP-binding protein
VSAPLLALEELTVAYGRGDARRGALEAFSLVLGEGESLAVVGESGAGKSTLARALAGLLRPAAGRVLWRGRDGVVRDVAPLPPAARRRLAPEIALVFQDPRASLDPRQTLGAALEEVLGARRGLPRAERRREAARLIERVGLEPGQAARRPGELSGGECQRGALARALAAAPRLVVLDEATASLDATVQAQIVLLVGELGAELGLARLWIAHELALVPHLAPRLVALHAGRKVAEGPSEELLARPPHPALERLVGAQRGTP